jgi:NADPH-dependent 2,4-dienoyl-CoA reductase/sulfur reductase-like enzyme
MKRRNFIQSLGAGAAFAAVAGCASSSRSAKAKVVVIGGGFGGATVAKYIRMWSGGAIEVTLVEPNAGFTSCPLSNLVLGGSKQIGDLMLPYQSLANRHGVRVLRDYATSIDIDTRNVNLAGGGAIAYDRLVLSPGIDFMYGEIPGMLVQDAADKVLHAWKAGPQTVKLRKQLEAMPDGGSFAISIPLAPFRCPPGPYERACQVAHYFSKAKKKSKVLILDANDDVASKGELFKKAWAKYYPGMIEYRPKFLVADVDATTRTAISDFGDKVTASVLNLIPPQRAGHIAADAGLANMNRRWCEVDFLTFESSKARNIHVLGDAIQFAPLMPKSGHMANQHGKICAAAVVDLLNDKTPEQNPLVSNTCYSFVSDKDAIHVASVHAYDAAAKTMLVVPGSGGLSATPTETEGVNAMAWARNIWADSLS